MKNKHWFSSFYNTIAKKSTECKFIKDPINPRKRKSSDYSTMHLFDGTTSEAQDLHPTTWQDHYWVIYYNVLNTVATSLKDWFNQSSFVVYKNIESLLLKTIKGEDTSDESEYIKLIYNDKINITQFEIVTDVLCVIFYEKKVDWFDSFSSGTWKLQREHRLLR